MKTIWWGLLLVAILAGGFGVWSTAADSPSIVAVLGAVTTFALAYLWLTGQLVFLHSRSQQTKFRVSLVLIPTGREEPAMLEIRVANMSEDDVRLVTIGFQEPDGSNRVELDTDPHAPGIGRLLTPIRAGNARKGTVMFEDFKSLGFELTKPVQALVERQLIWSLYRLRLWSDKRARANERSWFCGSRWAANRGSIP